MSKASPVTTSREPATVRVAMWSSRHRWPVFAGWFIATIGAVRPEPGDGRHQGRRPERQPERGPDRIGQGVRRVRCRRGKHADRRRHDRHHPPEPQGHRSGVPGLRGRHRHPSQGPDRDRRAARPSRSSTRSRIRRPRRRPPVSSPATCRRPGSAGGSPATRPRWSTTSCRSATRSPRSSPTPPGSPSTRSARR